MARGQQICGPAPTCERGTIVNNKDTSRAQTSAKHIAVSFSSFVQSFIHASFKPKIGPSWSMSLSNAHLGWPQWRQERKTSFNLKLFNRLLNSSCLSNLLKGGTTHPVCFIGTWGPVLRAWNILRCWLFLRRFPQRTWTSPLSKF